jgi:hypothetical protein
MGRMTDAEWEHETITQQHAARALAAGAKPEHVDAVLDRYAEKLHGALQTGRVKPEALDGDPEFHRRGIANVVKQNPHVHVDHAPPKAKEQKADEHEVVTKTISGKHAVTVPKAGKDRTFAPKPGDKGEKPLTGAEMRAKGIRYW